jgi:HK97 family phage portal protein
MIFSKALEIGSSNNTSQVNKKSLIAYDEFEHSADKLPEKVVYKELTFDTMLQMYIGNTWVRACVDKISMRASTTEPIIKAFLRKPTDTPTKEQFSRIEQVQTLIDVPNNGQCSFSSILQQVFTNILIWDAGALELVKGKRKSNVITSMYPVSGDTIRKNVDKRHIFIDPANSAYIQKDQYDNVVANFSMNELCYFMQYPMPHRVYGLSPLESLRQTVTAELYASDFNITRFINDATPKFAIMFENLGTGQGDAALMRLRQWWENELKGKPHKPILIGSEKGSIKFEKLGFTNEDMQFQEYQRWLLSKIMAIYHMQAAVLGVIEVNQGRINAEYQEKQFKKDALKPLLHTFSNAVNTLAIWSRSNFGFNDIYLAWDGLDSEDDYLSAQIHEIYLRQGVMTINMVLRELGMSEVPWGDVPYLLNQMQPLGGNIEGNNIPVRIPIDETNKTIDFDRWIKIGKTIGALPNGLEKVEFSDIINAITKLKKARESSVKTVLIPKSL